MNFTFSILQTVLIAGTALTLAACEVGPDYKPPEAEAPSAWNADTAQPDAKAEIDQQWWKNFNDPVLNQLIEKAEAGNFDLKIAEARIGQARASFDASVWALLPSGDVKGSATREANQLALPDANSLGPIGSLIKKPFNQYQTGFDASWELDLFGGMRRGEEQAAAQMEASEATRDDVRVSLMAEVARTYIDIRAAEAQLDVAEKTVASNRKSLDIAEQRFKAGAAPQLDVIQAEAELERTNTQIPALRSALAQAEYSMDVLLGEQPGATKKIMTCPAPIPLSDKQLVLAAPASVIAQRPDIRAAERKLAAATAQQGVASAKFYPDISLNGFFGVLNTSTKDLISPANQSWLTSGSVVWPILNFGTLSANLDTANAAQQEALATYQKTVLGALADVEKTLTAYNEQQKFVAAAQNEADKDRHARQIAEERYRAGLTSYTDVLLADRLALESQDGLVQARGTLAQDLIALYKALGGGWQRDADLKS